MKFNLQPNLSSRQDFQAAVLDIKKYAQWYSQASIKQQVSGGQLAQQPGVSQAAADLINQWQAGQHAGSQNLDELIAELEDFAAKAPFVTITLAAPAPSKLKAELVSWFRRNVRPDLLVDFNFNATMLGGMVVRYGSRVADLSFKRQILASRGKFPEVLRNV
jgi:hypothetical protein